MMFDAAAIISPKGHALQFKPGLIDDAAKVTNADTEAFLRNYMTEYAAFVARVLTVLPRSGS